MEVSSYNRMSSWKVSNWYVAGHLMGALLVRFVMIWFGEHQDQSLELKYTDADYHVFTDAARYVLEGSSPYQRHTYRYTPLIAWLLVPNHTLTPLFGKVLFSIIDVLCGFLMYKVNQSKEYDDSVALQSTFLWLYNPLPIVVSTRGNADCTVTFLILVAIYFLKKDTHLLGGMFHGLSVHMKLYPIIYLPSIYITCEEGPKRTLKDFLYPTAKRIQLIIGFILGVSLCTCFCYHFYGNKFVEEAYLYHVSRKDTRHNFSVYFYMLYLLIESTIPVIALIPFILQVIPMLALSWRFHEKQDLAFCLFAQTVVFVTFNKVVTSQYFLWYLCLLPICVPKLSMSRMEVMALSVIWFFGQASWLLPAYYLEFEGRNTFMYIWIESIAFFCSILGILGRIIKSYRMV